MELYSQYLLMDGCSLLSIMSSNFMYSSLLRHSELTFHKERLSLSRGYVFLFYSLQTEYCNCQTKHDPFYYLMRVCMYVWGGGRNSGGEFFHKKQDNELDIKESWPNRDVFIVTNTADAFRDENMRNVNKAPK